MTVLVRRRPAALVGLALALACGDATGPGALVVTGTIQNNTQGGIPASARLLVVWVVSSGGADYTYVHGEGELNASAGTFRVRLTPPPGAALNEGGLGVGVLLLTTDPSIGEGGDISNVPGVSLLGAAGQHGVIYVAGDPAEAAQFRDWAAAFPTGLSVGVGQEVPGAFDKFVPADPSGVVLTVDDLANIDFVDWT